MTDSNDNVFTIAKPRYPDPDNSPEQNWMAGEDWDDEGNRLPQFGPYQYRGVQVRLPLAFDDGNSDPQLCALSESYFYGVGDNAGFEFLQLTLVEPTGEPPLNQLLADAELSPFYGEGWEVVEDIVFARLREINERIFREGGCTLAKYNERKRSFELPTDLPKVLTQSCLWRRAKPTWSPRTATTTLNLMKVK